MGHDEVATIEDEVGDESMEEVAKVAVVDGVFFKLLDGEVEPVGEAHFFPVEMTEEFDIMVARHAEGGPRGAGFHGEAEDVWGVGSTVDEVADENESAIGMAGHVVFDFVAELIEESEKLGIAAVNITDDIEGAFDMLFVVPEGLAGDSLDGIDFIRLGIFPTFR